MTPYIILFAFRLAVQESERMINHSPEDLADTARLILDDLKKTQGQIPYSTNQRGMRYICMMVKTLQIINEILESRENYDSVIESFGIIYRTIPDPFVSQEDMKEFIATVWRILPFGSETLELIINLYTTLFENVSPKLYTPRSLKHLCRISLRHILMRNLKLLPHSVRKLHIPRDLHDYILCIEPEIFSNPIIHSCFDINRIACRNVFAE